MRKSRFSEEQIIGIRERTCRRVRFGHFGLAGRRTIPPRPGSNGGRGPFPCSEPPHKELIPAQF